MINVKKAVGYISCAVKSEEECQEQREAIELLAVKDGIEISHFYIDNGVSGSGKKPMLDILIEDAEMGLISKIYLKDITRLSRNTTILLNYLNLLMETDSEICFTHESVFNFNKDIILFLTTLTSMESASRSERIRNGIRCSRKNK